jgi:ferredoxin-NADP reductase
MVKPHRSWHGEAGPIDKEMLGRYLKGAVSPIYYVAGPPEMVEDMHVTINQAGVDGDDIRAEEFASYGLLCSEKGQALDCSCYKARRGTSFTGILRAPHKSCPIIHLHD